MNDDFLGTRNFLPQLCFQLGGRCEPVETGGYQQCHLNFRVPLPELRQHGGQDVPAGHGAGVVGNDDGTALLPCRQRGKTGRSDGRRHGFLHQLPGLRFLRQRIQRKAVSRSLFVQQPQGHVPR